MLRSAFLKKKSKQRRSRSRRRIGYKSVVSKTVSGGRRLINNRRPPSTVYKPLALTPNSTLIVQPATKYAASLIDPFKYRGVRIPDLACHPSVTYSLEFDTTITLVSGANDGIIIPLCGNAGIKDYNNSSGAMSAQVGLGTVSTVATSYSQSRIVSAQCVVKFAGDNNQQSGSIVCAFIQAGDSSGSGGFNNVAMSSRWLDQGATLGLASNEKLISGVPSDNPELTKRRNSYLGPITDGCILQYRPADADDFIYRQTTNGVNATSFNSVPIFNINCGFVVGIRGVTPTQGRTFTVSVIVNCEALPVDDTIGLPGVGIYVNPQAQAFGLNAAANFPICSGATALDFARQAKAVSF